MRFALEKQLEAANKWIFVRRYHQGEQVIRQMLEDSEAMHSVLVHLRRIELSTKTGNTEDLKTEYQKMTKDPSVAELANLCLLFIEQLNQNANSSLLLAKFQEHIKDYGASSAAFYGMAFALESMGSLDRALYNYEESTRLDPKWYPSFFGMSQIYYQKGDEKRGDHFFYLFEESAPYNVYGNFETHRHLYEEFLQKNEFSASKAAIQSLSEWWIENRGFCPPEIQVFEAFALSKIAAEEGQQSEAQSFLEDARAFALAAMEAKTRESVLFFIARTLEEFGEQQLALECYRTVLRMTSGDPRMVQKVGGQFLTMGDYDAAEALFKDAYELNPDQPEVRFFLLVTGLKKNQVQVEDYLVGKERLKHLSQNQGDRVEILALLHNLLSKYQFDSEVHQQMAEIYVRLGNLDKAVQHFEKATSLDPKGSVLSLRYSDFLLRHDQSEKGLKVLERLASEPRLSPEQLQEVRWLRASYAYQTGNYQSCLDLISGLLSRDPWNISYLVYEAASLSYIHRDKLGDDYFDVNLKALLAEPDAQINWRDFDKESKKAESAHLYHLAYARRKLRFLYANGDEKTLLKLIVTSCRYEASKGIYDFVRLINTNFDGPEIYWAIASMYKENWQLETACSWYEQCLLHPDVADQLRGRALLDCADSYLWRGLRLDKAIEYAKLSMDLSESVRTRAVVCMAHALIKKGEVRQAELHLQQIARDSDPEVVYLKGLIAYRNGQEAEAKKHWKPLLTMRSESLRFHQIKQLVLKYYYDGQPYLKAN